MKNLTLKLAGALLFASLAPVQAATLDKHKYFVRCEPTARQDVEICKKYLSGVLIAKYYRTRVGNGFYERNVYDD